MKSLTRIIIVLVVFNLAMGSFALAEKTPEGKLSTYTISGSVGLSDVEMQGLPGSPVTASDGTYKATVEHGWTGRVMPVKEGYTFEPATMIYRKITNNRDNQNYAVAPITFTISGEAGVGGAVMKGLPGNPVTSKDGTYKAGIMYGWSGTVTPTKKGYSFEPPEQRYTKVIRDLTNQNYVAELITYTISDVIMVGGRPIQGVRVSANNGGGSDVTDSRGRFSVKVPYGWSGEITLEKEGFRLPSKSYTNVTKNIKDGGLEPPRRPRRPSSRGRITTTAQPYEPAVGRIGGRKVLVIPDSEVKPEELDAITQDLLVMSHILDERFREPRTIKRVFTDFGDFFGRNNRSTETIYMQGYGVVFLMEVNFAFSPPLISEEQKDEETAEHIDPTWQRARQQIFSPKAPRPGMPGFSGQGPGLVKFDQLKKELIETLKHAANIRNLTPDEWIILTVIGQSRQPGEFYEDYYRSAAPRSRTSGRRRSSSSERGGLGGVFGGSYSAAGGSVSYGGGYAGSSAGGYGGAMMGGMVYSEMAPPSTTVLTIRAKKSDVDAFAKGELDFEQFQETVEIFTY